MTTKQMSALFVDTGGELPPMWSRRVTFFANLLALFFGNESQTRDLAAEVGEIDSYGARLIPILNLLFRGGENLLVLERDPDEVLCRYLEDDLGLSLPKLKVMRHADYVELDHDLKTGRLLEAGRILEGVSRHAAEWIDGYVTDETLTRIAEYLECRTISSMASSKAGNNKLLLHRFLAESGLPAFDTAYAACGKDLEHCAKEMRSRGYSSMVLRSEIGASGIGMMRLRDLDRPENFPEIPEYLFFEGPCLVQGWLEPGVNGVRRILSPSTQLFLDEEKVYAYDLTEQILSHESIHQGNESPPPYLSSFPGLREEMMRQGAMIGSWLRDTGYRGTASIDWLVVERDGKPQPDLIACEINARVTGATYPSLLARHFHSQGAWLLRNLRLRTPTPTCELLQMFERPGHLFLPGKRAGILPLNLNFGRDGLVHKGQFLCIGNNVNECHRFLSLAEQDLPVQWDTDRD